MYRITNISTRTDLGAVDEVVYIEISSSGCFVPTTEDKAIGIALKGVPYNLIGQAEIEGADTVVVSKVDGGVLFAEQQDIIDTFNIDHEYRLTLLELGLSDI